MTFERQFNIILFDLEGTLVDFQWQLNDAAREILELLQTAGIESDLYGESPNYAGLYNTTRDITKTWKTEDAARLFDQLDRVYNKYDQDALSRWMTYPDTQDLLDRLSARGYQMGIVSNCGAHAAGEVLEKFGLTQFFEIILSRDDLAYLKPHPEGLILAVKKLATPAEKILFVGDSRNDILAANQSSMPSCFLSSGESLVTGKNAGTATFQVSSLSELADHLAG